MFKKDATFECDKKEFEKYKKGYEELRKIKEAKKYHTKRKIRQKVVSWLRKIPDMHWILYLSMVLLFVMLLLEAIPYFSKEKWEESELVLYGEICSDDGGNRSPYELYVGNNSEKVFTDMSYEIPFSTTDKQNIVVVLLNKDGQLVYYKNLGYNKDEERKCLDIQLE